MEKKSKQTFILILVLLVVAVTVAIGMGSKLGQKAIEFPYELEGGKLVVNSLFQASIENPDCNNEIGEDTASLEIVNQSDEYCDGAEISVKMQDGSQYTFKIFDVPAGKSVWAFETANQSMELEGQCVKIDCNAKFRNETDPMEAIEYEVNDTVITVRNLTDREMKNVSVYYHCLFDDAYYGGISYHQVIEKLSAKEELKLQADECYMGIAEVVDIVKE